MLRALGILFIVGCILFALVLGAGMAWVCLKTDVPQQIVNSLQDQKEGVSTQPNASQTVQNTPTHDAAVLQPQPSAARQLQSSSAPQLSAVPAPTQVGAAPAVQKRFGDGQAEVRQTAFFDGSDSTAPRIDSWRILLDGGKRIYAEPTEVSEILLKSDQCDIEVTLANSVSDAEQWDEIRERIEASGRLNVVGPPDEADQKTAIFSVKFLDLETRLRIPESSTPSTLVRVPGSGALSPPKIRGLSPYRYVTSMEPLSGPFEVYDNFLRMRVLSPSSRARIELLLFRSADGTAPFTFHSTIRLSASNVLTEAPDGTKEILVELPSDGGTFDVQVVQRDGNLFRFGDSVQVVTKALSRAQADELDDVKLVMQKAYAQTSPVTVNLSGTVPNNIEWVLFLDGSAQPVKAQLTQTGKTASLEVTPGRHALTGQLWQGGRAIRELDAVTFYYLQDGPRVEDVDSRKFVEQLGKPSLTLYFTKSNRLDDKAAETNGNYTFEPTLTVSEADFDPDSNSVTLRFDGDIHPGPYTLTIKAADSMGASGIKDSAGNPLNKTPEDPTGGNHVVNLVFSGSSNIPTEQRGVVQTHAPYVPYQEYTEPRENPTGFNPSDKVVTRVARLYYFRDAHRVVQIVNRKARSYNRQAVTMQQQIADQARSEADEAADRRMELERKAVRAAQAARAAEEALEEHQRALIDYRGQLGDAQEKLNEFRQDLAAVEGELEDASDDEATELRKRRRQIEVTISATESTVSNLQSRVSLEEQSVTTLLAQVQAKRTEEIEATEHWENAEQNELRKREEEFRREVAAKTADPDTFAPGNPDSDDPVAQVSLSVIGEGLIQLRGPRKGVNIVHTMINQIDAPVGQVRIGIHTIQVNGEHGDRMEKVVMRIQRYLDHSRFLTMQSAQMLRNAVVAVAARRAMEVDGLCPPGTPAEIREIKYREAFFGKDFVDELREMDSEFLHSGNKVLSLHSMDTTSLANALFLLALAKNDTRQEILAEFMAQVETKLPCDEMDYFTASGAEFKFRHKKFEFMGHNARFVSLRGFFDAEVTGADTLNPLQREFIRLAQIFKSKLVTEIELRQRVMERALIEERIGTPEEYRQQLRDARKKEREAQQKVQDIRTEFRENQIRVLSVVREIETALTALQRESEQLNTAILNSEQRITEILEEYILSRYEGVSKEELRQKIRSNVFPERDPRCEYVTLKSRVNNLLQALPRQQKALTSKPINQFGVMVGPMGITVTQPHKARAAFQLAEQKRLADSIVKMLDRFNHVSPSKEIFEYAKARLNQYTGKDSDTLQDANILLDVLGRLEFSVNEVLRLSNEWARQLRSVATRLAADELNVNAIYTEWQELEEYARVYLKQDDALYRKAMDLFAKSHQSFQSLLQEAVKLEHALKEAEEARRPLDHKKFLDMLVDDVEEKYIELVEGTRAQTANIDNYLKRLTTALEDDFNTQFYYPAFRYIRETSYYWDVQVGQIQTESILTNNRMYARMSPQATMEFDLPKRDILINEAFDSALAAYNDYGALVSDPNFLALTRMYGGSPPSATYTGQLPAPLVRDVLPGLPAQTDEQFLSQGANNRPEIGANLEALIPDPAVYKFETGTGFDVRPVIQPDGQAVVFHLNYLFSTNIREPVRADEKHLGRVKRHFVDTDVVTGNYELREVSRFQVALKASRTARGVPLLEDIPVAGWLFRPLPQAESSLQENLIYAQSVIYPTLYDLMGLRWAPAVADLDSLSLQEREFVTRNREKVLRNEVFDYSSLQVDEFMRIPKGERRGDLYRTQETIPYGHPNGYRGSGLNLENSELQEGYAPERAYPKSEFIPERSDAGQVTPHVPFLFQEAPTSRDVPGAAVRMLPQRPAANASAPYLAAPQTGGQPSQSDRSEGPPPQKPAPPPPPANGADGEGPASMLQKRDAGHGAPGAVNPLGSRPTGRSAAAAPRLLQVHVDQFAKPVTRAAAPASRPIARLRKTHWRHPVAQPARRFSQQTTSTAARVAVDRSAGPYTVRQTSAVRTSQQDDATQKRSDEEGDGGWSLKKLFGR